MIDCGKGSKDVAFYDKGNDMVKNCTKKNPPTTATNPVRRRRKGWRCGHKVQEPLRT